MSFDARQVPGTPGPPTGEDMDLVATHQRLLIAAALRTVGPILELGCGAYSTPLLHEIARAQSRLCVTADNNPDWLSQWKRLQNTHHEIWEVGWWGDFYRLAAGGHFATRWGLVFVDHGQPIEREYAVRALIDAADVFVLHDTEEGFAYGYSRTLPLFSYRWEDAWQLAKTTVASNRIDVREWGLIQLPPVRPSRGVT
jgi:hypothetical protein